MKLPRRVLRVRRSGVIAPFGELARDLPVLGAAIARRQERALGSVGLHIDGEADAEEPREPDALYLDDDVDIAPGALAAWLKVAGDDTWMAVLERPQRIGELEVEERVWMRDGVVLADADPRLDRARILAEWPGALPVRLVGVRWGSGQRVVRIPELGLSGRGKLPGPFGGGQELDWAIDVRTATTVRHWVHLLRAHLAALGAAIWTEMLLQPWRLAWAWARHPRARPMAVVGAGCSIHPTASIEGCILEDGVQIGAYSRLQGCWVGKGSIVEDHVTARLSAIGPAAHVANYSMFNMSVLGERSSVGHIGGQACVIGRESFVSTFATLQDLNLRGNVKVWMDGALRDTGIPFLGCAVGHGVKLGSGLTIAPGRMVPSGVNVVAGGVVSRIAPELAAGNYRVEGGALVREPGA